MNSLQFKVGDILTMKKIHPCGSAQMRVLRVGSDIRLLCLGCGRDMTVQRVKIEKHIKGVSHGEEDME